MSEVIISHTHTHTHTNRHRCMNMFLQFYCNQWLVSSEHCTHDKLTEELLDKQDYLVSKQQEELKSAVNPGEVVCSSLSPDPLTQLLHMFRRIATSRDR